MENVGGRVSAPGRGGYTSLYTAGPSVLRTIAALIELRIPGLPVNGPRDEVASPATSVRDKKHGVPRSCSGAVRTRSDPMQRAENTRLERRARSDNLRGDDSPGPLICGAFTDRPGRTIREYRSHTRTERGVVGLEVVADLAVGGEAVVFS